MITINIPDEVAADIARQVMNQSLARRTTGQVVMTLEDSAKKTVTRSYETRPKIMAELLKLSYGEKFTTNTIAQNAQLDPKKTEAMLANLIKDGFVTRVETGVYQKA